MRPAGKDYLLDSVPEFFAPVSEPLPAGLASCSRTPARVDFLHAPLFSYQMDVLRQYVETMRQPGRELIVITYIGVWTKVNPLLLPNQLSGMLPIN